MSGNIPDELKYTKEHEWVRVRGGEAEVGITHHAQELLTDVVFVELPEPGATFGLGEEAAVVESVKSASDVYAPLSGEISAVNARLTEAPELVNSDPYGEGWFFKMKMSDPAECDGLLSAADYAKLIDREKEN